MNTKSLLLILLIIITTASCRKDDINISDTKCSKIQESLLNYDVETAKDVFDKLTNGLKPKTTSSDNIGHLENFNTLVNELNECENFNAELFCYACIETLPAQTEIKIVIDSNGVGVTRVLDFLTPENDDIEFRNIHQ